MQDLTRLVHSPGAHSMAYVDLAFPDRHLTLHAACPQNSSGFVESYTNLIAAKVKQRR